MSTPDHWPLARWADRNPSVRYPLLVLAIFVLYGIAGWLDQLP